MAHLIGLEGALAQPQGRHDERAQDAGAFLSVENRLEKSKLPRIPRVARQLQCLEDPVNQGMSRDGFVHIHTGNCNFKAQYTPPRAGSRDPQ